MLEEKQHYLNLMGPPRVDAHRKYLDTVEPATGEARAALPNIVVIMMDDMGWGDMSAFGSKAIHTPNLDKLAADGMTFTNGSENSAECLVSGNKGKHFLKSLVTNLLLRDKTVYASVDQ
jgi:hypothetical protein